MSDADDYESDDILAQCLAAASGSSRKALATTKATRELSREEKRKLELFKRKREQEVEQEKVKQARLEKSRIAETRREEGLNTAIEAENKGFQLLAKMGYKPGTTLGRQPEARTEPIKPVIKVGRSGLGKAEAESEKARKIFKAAEERASNREGLARDYRLQKSAENAARLMRPDLMNSQKACRAQDEDSGVTEPLVPWFWPQVEAKPTEDVRDDDDYGELRAAEKRLNVEEEPEEEEEEEEEELSDVEKLEQLTDYLRSKHFYCVWCGIKFSNEEELKYECPGNTRDDH